MVVAAAVVINATAVVIGITAILVTIANAPMVMAAVA